MNCNLIDQLAIRDLLDGRTFFIPAYQRGYRWAKTQIYDLCNDLLEYALKPRKKQGAFYSLQPLIVKKNIKMVAGQEKDVYEVIDGQQRLTTIHILYKVLMAKSCITSAEVLKERRDVAIYHIFYETRPNDYDCIEQFSPVRKEQIKDIDLAHIANCYNYINQWLSNDIEKDPQCARSTWKMFTDEKFILDDAVSMLFNLLNNPKGTTRPEGNAQFIWYEIDATKNDIQEFLAENKGKIPLTDTEKIRALFMQRRDNAPVADLVQMSMAKDWERIENTLHRNDFWSFISNDTHKEDGRINLIFQYLYDRDASKDTAYQGDDRLFRYYYQKFNTRSHSATIAVEEWDKVMEAFQMLQNWYQNPRIYNLVGLLIKEKKAAITIKEIAGLYDKPDTVTTEDFITNLKKEVCRTIIDLIPISTEENKELEMEKEDKHISLFFNKSADKEKIPGLLRFLNVNVLCQQIEGMLKDVDKDGSQKKASDMGRSNRDELCAIYRFPFDALDAFGWDVEHIDSATTNALTNSNEQETWKNEAEQALGDKLTKDRDFSEQKAKWENAQGDVKASLMNNMLAIIKTLVGEDDVEARKNWIGNLTLLDSGTNRMYKNAIFAKKRQTIQERIRNGVFVPVCTQNIFNKTYPLCTKDNLKWDFNDKKCYHAYILATIEDFKQKYEQKK